jgi:ubiquinol-cytochrome c reductase cytochrome b subunit
VDPRRLPDLGCHPEPLLRPARDRAAAGAAGLLVVAHIIALHEVGSNNPDGVEIKKNKDANGVPLDGIPFHPYYTVKDIVGVASSCSSPFAVSSSPRNGRLLPGARQLRAGEPAEATPEHIAPVWYFTPFYAILL